jgi:hypothetical protein
MTTRHHRFAAPTAATFILLITAQAANAVSFGALDDFEAGTTAGWGGGAPTSNVADAGPAGVGDNALRIAATGGRVAIVNTAQWTGDYIAAGVTKLLMDVRNDNAFTLQMRLGLAKGAVGPGGAGDTYVSASAAAVPSDGLWHRIAISLSAADLVPHAANTNPAPDGAAALASVSHFRILHNPVADFLGGVGPATFHLDNIRAVPEPATLALAACATVILAIRRRSRSPL